MLSISKDANKNYLAKIVEITNIRKHDNADKLQITIIDFNSVIIDLSYKIGDVCVFFPVECQIHKEFLSFLNCFREKDLNEDKEKVGFFEKNSRVRAVKLRGEKSMGFLIKLNDLERFCRKKIEDKIGTEFNYIDDNEFVKKYELPVKTFYNKNGKTKTGISRLVDNQFRFHIETENLRKNAYAIKPTDYISITYKLHGSSVIVSNVLVKKKLNFLQKLFYKDITEYDVLYSSRKVIKNEYETKDKNGYYSFDIWGDVKKEIEEYIPKGVSIYGEIVGFLPSGEMIQKSYDYGCENNQHKLFVYRITTTNQDGQVIEFSTLQIKEFCERNNLNYVPLFYYGMAKDLYPELNTENHWNEEFVKRLEKDYNDKDCFICKNKVPEEGIVIRKESVFSFEAYKLKSFSFLEYESKQLDNGVVDLESIN